MSGKPIKAARGQDHQAHIMVKTAFLQAPQMQGENDPTVAVGKQLLTANIAEHKVRMFGAQVGAAAEQQGTSLDSEQVQGQIAQQLMQASAAQNPQQGPGIEQQMLQLQAQELQMAGQRIQSQDTREAAKIALKQRELDLKETGMLLDAQQKQKQNQISASGKILDNSAKLADIQAKKLAERANQNMP